MGGLIGGGGGTGGFGNKGPSQGGTNCVGWFLKFLFAGWFGSCSYMFQRLSKLTEFRLLPWVFLDVAAAAGTIPYGSNGGLEASN
jgi:hypothetical protein